MLDPGRGTTKTGRLWCYVRDDRPFGGTAPPAVLYRYSPDRKGEHPRTHLAGFRGILQADGYTGYVASEFMLFRRPLAARSERLTIVDAT